MGPASAFWSPSIWLPPNVTWADFSSRPDSAQFDHLLLPFPLALLLIALRLALERAVFRPLGIWLGVSHTARVAGTGQTERQVEGWGRRRLAGRKSNLDKFAEAAWKWLFYGSAHVASMWWLWDKAWVWDTFHCWYEYPFHPIDSAVWWHYMLELAFYWSLFITQFFDVQRKDFWEMFIHHVATLVLITLSWTNHMHRIGSLVLMVHDLADPWLEFAKLSKYAGFERCCNLSFVMFCLTWTYSRLGIFPTWIIYSTTVEAAQLVQMFPVYYIFNFLMTLLLILHVVWHYMTIQVAYKALTTGQTEDCRSESGSDNEEEGNRTDTEVLDDLNEDNSKKFS